MQAMASTRTMEPLHQSIGQQMWSRSLLNVESYVEPLRSPRSRVVAHRPPRPIGDLF